MPYPTSSDATTFLGTIPESNVSGSYDLTGVISGLVRQFEDLTGRAGFYGTGSPVTVTYNPPDPRSGRQILYIDDFYEISQVVVDITPSTPAGKLLTVDVDYTLLPDNPSARPYPWEQIQFWGYLAFDRRSIQVTGLRGYQPDVPQDVFEAILAAVAAKALTNSVGTAGSIKTERQGERSVTYETSKPTIDRLWAEWSACVERYVKVWN